MAAIPPALKVIVPYLTISKQFEKRDVAVAYYLKMFALQEGIDAGKDSESKSFLFSIMSNVEEMKRQLKEDHDDKLDEVVAQSHLEAIALRLFDVADARDRNAKFDKSVIKSFYTSSYIFNCLKQFGELDEEIEKKMKYAKWKAVEIDRCLKNGITPTPGPPGGDEFGGDELGDELGGGISMPQPPNMGGGGIGDPGPSTSSYYPPMDPSQDRPVPKPRSNIPYNMPPAPSDQSTFPTTTPYPPANPYPSYPPPSSEGGGAYPGMGNSTSVPGSNTGGGVKATSSNDYSTGGTSDPVIASSVGGAAKLGPGQVVQAQKYCKFASSALEYDDSEGAIDYLTKALKLLKTGKES